MTTIRAATAADYPALAAMSRRFLSADGPYEGRMRLDETRLEALVARMTTSAEALTLVAERDGAAVGMFSVFLFDHPITGARVAAELCWWIEPEARGSRAALAMLRRGEQWARHQGATVMEMIAPTEHVAQFYERLGYRRTDVHYLRTL
jgi:predicted N-acetyltransferase YhbS